MAADNDDDYAVQTINCDMSEDECHKLFLQLCKNVREIDRSDLMKGELESKGLINLDFYPDLSVIRKDRRILRLKMRNDDYYILGYQRPDDSTLWEAYEKNAKQGYLKGSKKLPFNSSYLNKQIVGKEVSHNAFCRAIFTLADRNPGIKNFNVNNEIENAFFTLVLFIAEGSRFRWTSYFVAKVFEENIADEIQEWYKKLARNWSNLSDEVERFKIKYPNVRLPIKFKDLTQEDIDDMERFDTDMLFCETDPPRAAAVCLMISKNFKKDAAGELGGHDGPHMGRGGPHMGRGGPLRGRGCPRGRGRSRGRGNRGRGGEPYTA